MNSDTSKSKIPTWIKYLLVIVITTVIGGLARLTNDIYIGTFLFNLDVQMPVSRWLESIGIGGMGIKAWWIFWFYWSEWLIAEILGVMIGVGMRNYWQVASFSCGLAFIFSVDLLMILTLPKEELPQTWFGFGASISVFKWHIVSALLIILFAYRSSGTTDTKQETTE